VAQTVTREALRETATALRLNKPVLALLIASVAFLAGWWWFGQPAWGAIAALVAALILFVPLFLWNLISVTGKRLMVLEAKPDENLIEAAKEVRERRRKIIDQAREMVSAHELQKNRSWDDTMRFSPAFAAVRPHLRPNFFEASRTIVLSGSKQVHEYQVERFVKELDRLEREWGLS
jgi:hypothetical protein